MLIKQIEKITDVMIKEGISKCDDKEVIIYGLCTGIEIFFNIITTIVLGSLFGLIFESLVFLISFSIIRTYAGGYHCQKAVNCYFFSSGIVVLVLSIIKFIPKEYTLIVSTVLLLFSIPTLLKIAPVETLNKPLDEKERKHYHQKTSMYLSIEFIIFIVLLLIELHNFAFTICLGIVVSALLAFLQRKLY